MKKLFAFTLFMALASTVSAQKNELKAIEKAVKAGDFATAKSTLSTAESLIGNMDDKTKAKFYFFKTKSLFASGSTDAEVDSAIESLEKLKQVEAKMGKPKYTDEASKIATAALGDYVSKAGKAYESKDFSAATKGFERVYKMSPTDTIYLYYAASASVSGKDYDTAIKHYKVLKDIGYTGEKIVYYATEAETGEEQPFADKSTRNLYVKAKSHISPRDAKTESKRPEIIKNIAVILIAQGKKDEALSAISEARAQSPEDTSLMVSEANVYMELGDESKASELYSAALAKEPDNKDLNYNVAVLQMNAGKTDEASTYFQKVLELDPSYANAVLNLSTIEINKGNALLDQMNNLGTSSADFAKYDKLKEQKNNYFMQGVKILETFLAKNPTSKSIDLYTQLKNIYGALGETDKMNKIKEKLEGF